MLIRMRRGLAAGAAVIALAAGMTIAGASSASADSGFIGPADNDMWFVWGDTRAEMLNEEPVFEALHPNCLLLGDGVDSAGTFIATYHCPPGGLR